jgi:hypothetical protein
MLSAFEDGSSRVLGVFDETHIAAVSRISGKAHVPCSGAAPLQGSESACCTSDLT